MALDLDGTVVSCDGQIPPEIQTAVRRARTAGHRVAVLTGRHRASAAPFVEALEVTGPYSVTHGAHVLDGTGRTLRVRRIRTLAVRQLVAEFGRRPGIAFACMRGATVFVADPEHPRWDWARSTRRLIEPYDPELAVDADKIVLYAEDGLRDILSDLEETHPELLTHLWAAGSVELTAPGTDKGTALELISKTLGVPRADVVAFGDAANDVPMLAWAGRAVAVGSDPPRALLRVACDHVPSPEQGGVARWIDEHL